MKISVFFYASTLESKSKNARRPMGGSIGDLRASSASSAAANKDSRKEDSVCELLETRKGSRASYHMNVRFSLFCIHDIIYNRLKKNHTKHFDLSYNNSD